MTTMTLSPTPRQRFYGNNGAPLVNGLLFTYAAGTTTKIASYTSSTGLSLNSNPIQLDARGECDLWIPPNVAYKLTLAPAGDSDPPTNPIFTVDQIVNSQLITLYGGVDTGIENAYVLTFVANYTAYQDGIYIVWIPVNSNTGAVTINVNGLGVVPIINGDGSALSAGEILANSPTTIIYKGGSFILANNTVYSGTFTGTLTGGATSPTQTIRYTRSGSIVTIKIPSYGAVTSNSTTMTITGAPAIIVPNVSTGKIAIPMLTDNSASVFTGCGITVLNSSGTFVFNINGTGGFTAANLKGLPIDTTFTYSV